MDDVKAKIQDKEGFIPTSKRPVMLSIPQPMPMVLVVVEEFIQVNQMDKPKAFDEKHQLRANASAKVISLDERVGLTEKFGVAISVVNEKVKSVDQKLQVSDKTMAT
ncbi:hypothetical protein OSB04_un001835 [Centaurea solstitialis]|uniref:Uncharacterized protein n=1 Tax=Centaurea solstitialis TaxID=347529 RepID=A0AA38SF90_9ASTR|nr:hypothetical protein OSB04_un001835 [Centaurea solstitialis]